MTPKGELKMTSPSLFASNKSVPSTTCSYSMKKSKSTVKLVNPLSNPKWNKFYDLKTQKREPWKNVYR